jgi:hypothetical protein
MEFVGFTRIPIDVKSIGSYQLLVNSLKGTRSIFIMNEPKYKLAQGAQVREEDFGLLFYHMHG